MALFSRFGRDNVDIAELEDEYVLSDAALARSRSIGVLLREARQGFGRNVDQIGEALRIKPSYLQAIEDGRYEELPGPTYTVGFIRAYAEYLGLDGNEILRRFKQETEGLEFRRDLSFPMPLTERSVPGGTILLVGVIFALCGYGIWYYVSSADRARPERVAAVPTTLLAPTSDAAAVTPSASPPTPAEAAAASPPANSARTQVPPAPASPAPPPQTPPSATLVPAPPLPPLAPPVAIANLPAVPAAPTPAPPDPAHLYGETKGPSRISIRVNSDCWLEVRESDQTSVFKRLMRPGDVYKIPDKPGLSVRVGNAKGVEVSVDGKTVTNPAVLDILRRAGFVDPRVLLAAAQ
jgi:cytoskeleton protein RodZ